MPRIALAVPLLVLLGVLAGPTPAGAEDKPGTEDDGASGAEAAEGPDAERARRRKERQEFEQRKADLPARARPTLEIIEAFRREPLRLWMDPMDQVALQGRDAVPALVLMLEAFDWELRAFAAACLEPLAAPEALRPLVRAVREETFFEARRRMVKALGALRSQEAVGALVEATQDEEHEGIVLAAVRGLGRLSGTEVVETLAGFLTHEDLDIRYEALGALAAAGHGRALARLRAAAEALVDTRDEQRRPSLEAMDVGERYEQYLIGTALARVDTEAMDEFLEDVLRAEKPWDKKIFLRLGTAEGLGRRVQHGGSLHPDLVEGLFHDDNDVRVACSYGIGFVGDPSLLRKLKRALRDSQLDVQVNVVRAIGRIGTGEAAELLQRALRDRAEEVRTAATRALADIAHPEATKGLRKALDDRKYVMRVLAARALARRTAEPDVVDDLIDAADDRDYGVRAQAIASLSRASGRLEDVVPVIAAAAKDRDVGVRANSFLGMSSLAASVEEPLALPAPFVDRAVRIATETPVPRVERAAVEMLDSIRPPGAVPRLLDAMEASEAEVRRRAHRLLQRMAEKIMAFDPEASPLKRKDALEAWRRWWESTGELPERDRHFGLTVTGSLNEVTRDLKWRGLDVVLALDSTGSMAGLLRAAKRSIDELILSMSSPLPSLRISLFTYRDLGDNYVYYGTPLTRDFAHLPGFLQSFVHGQGGDIPEAVSDTFRAASRELDWREDAHKVFIFAGDAPHHPDQDRLFRRNIREWATKDNRAVLHAIFTDTNRRSLDINRRKEREEPEDFEHPFFEQYRSIAAEGRGRAVLLSDESALIKEILVLAFGPAWRADIENLLDFRR